MATNLMTTCEGASLAIAFHEKFSEHECDAAMLLRISDKPGEWRPDAHSLDRALLNKLLDGKPLTKKEGEFISMWTEWVPQMESSLWWWRDLSEYALRQLLSNGEPESDIDLRLSQLAVREEGVLTALCRARRQQFKDLVNGFEGHSSEAPTRELAMQYGLYVRHVDALVLEAFPRLNRALLFNPFPEWGITSRRPEWIA